MINVSESRLVIFSQSFRGHLHMLFIIKVRFSFLFDVHIGLPNYIDLSPRMVKNSKLVVQTFSNTCLFGCPFLDPHLNYTPLKYIPREWQPCGMCATVSGWFNNQFCSKMTTVESSLFWQKTLLKIFHASWSHWLRLTYIPRGNYIPASKDDIECPLHWFLT